MMNVTHIRIRKLVSRDTGYGHDAAEIEAQVEDGDDWEQVAIEVHRMVDSQIRQGKEAYGLRHCLDDLRTLVHNIERERDDLAKQISENRKIIQPYEKLEILARNHGIDTAGLNDDGIPF
jgi:hypothetical protein